MKKIFNLFVAMLVVTTSYAVPARPGWQTKSQPDGSTIQVRLVGDEFHHYWTDANGNIVKQDANGYWQVLTEQPALPAKAAQRYSSARHIASPVAKAPATGSPRGLVILVNFKDQTFQSVNNQSAMHDMMNADNYTYNGATGSVAKYFADQSNGQYTPVFDVVGPVTLPYSMSRYGANDSEGNDLLPGDMVVEACSIANALHNVDFTRYDNDYDGYLDFVYIIYAGKGEADGGTENTIWPHSWDVYSAEYFGNCRYNESKRLFDNKYIYQYACSGELDGPTGKRAGIGTIAHEFSHVIGLPDLYDIDYGQNYEDEMTPGVWHLMDHGSYNNDGKTPPSYTIYDKYFLGWLKPQNPGNTPQELTLAANEGYQIASSNSLLSATTTNTVYYIENRQQSGWDAHLPGHGMLIWKITYNQAAWDNNGPNVENGNLRYALLSASGQTTKIGTAVDPFPGTKRKTEWRGISSKPLLDITENDGLIRFTYIEAVDNDNWTYEVLYENATVSSEAGNVAKGGTLTLTVKPATGYLLDETMIEVEENNATRNFTYSNHTLTINDVQGDLGIYIMPEQDPNAPDTPDTPINSVVTFVPSDFDAIEGKSFEVEKNGVTLSCSSGTINADQFRFFKSQTLTISSTAGNITSIEFTCTAANNTKYGPGGFGELEGYSYADKVGTWTGNAASVTFATTNNQVRATQIVVTLVGTTDPEDPTDPEEPTDPEDPTDPETPSGTFTFDADADKGDASFDATNQTPYTVSKDGITMDVTKGIIGTYNNENHYRVYKGETLTLTSTVGNIVSVEFTCTADDDAKYGPGCFTVSTGDYTYSGPVGTWKGSADQITFTASTNQVRVTQIVVTISGTTDPEDPTDPEEPEVNTNITGLKYADAYYYEYDGVGYYEIDMYKDIDLNTYQYDYPEVYIGITAKSKTALNGTYELYYAGYWASVKDSVEMDYDLPATVTIQNTDNEGNYSVKGTFVGTDGLTYTFDDVVSVWAFDFDNWEEITLDESGEPTDPEDPTDPTDPETPAGTVTFDADVDKGNASLDATNQTAYTVSKDGITMDVTKGIIGTYNNENHYRVYKGETLTLTSTIGNIVSVEFTCTADDDAKYGPGCFTVSTGDYTYSGPVGTWTGEAKEVAFTAFYNQVRATQIVVTIAGTITGVDNLDTPTSTTYKILRNGQILIINHGKTYGIDGQAR